jgi:hypothetical protein
MSDAGAIMEKTSSVSKYESRFKFPDCKNSIFCASNGCREQYTDSELTKFSKEDGLCKCRMIHNRDIVTYERKVPVAASKYYEFISIYEDSINEDDDSFIPWCHKVSIRQSRKFDKLSGFPSTYACGGCNFILKKINKRNNTETVLCSNGWPGYEDGWQK